MKRILAFLFLALFALPAAAGENVFSVRGDQVLFNGKPCWWLEHVQRKYGPWDGRK